MSTKGTKVPAIKNIPAKVDPELRSMLDSVKEAVEVRLGRRGDPRDRAVTLRELIDSGLAEELRGSPFDPNGVPGIGITPPKLPPGDLSIPPAPTGLEASGAFTQIIVNWNAAQYGNHAYTEVFRSRNDEIGGAILVTTSNSFVITDVVGYDQEFYYWVRFVSTSDIRGPFNKTNGVKASTLEDIAATMAALSEELSNLPGYSAITGLITTQSAVAARVIRSSGSPSTREDGTALVINDIWFDTDDGQIYTRNAANNAWVPGKDATLTALYGSTNYTGNTITGAVASAQSDIITVTNAHNSTASTLSSLGTTVTNNNNTLTSAISSEATSRTNADNTTATNINNLTSTVNAKTQTFAQNGIPTSISAGDLWIDTNDNNKVYRAGSAGSDAVTSGEWALLDVGAALSTAAALSSEQTTRANADSANATSISNLSSTVTSNNNTLTASVNTLSTATSNLNGDVNAMFVLQVATESNGTKSAAGMVIGSNANSGSGAQSYVQFQADKFAVWSGSAAIAPFIIVGGVVYIADARIQDGAITNARIANGTIESAKIASATIVAANIADGVITNAKIANATIDNAKITATLDAAKITAGLINSDRINVNTLNIKHFDNVSTDIKSHRSNGAFVPLAVEANVQSWSGTYPGQTIISSETSSVVNISCTTAEVRNNAKYRVVVSGVYGNVRNGTVQYSFSSNFSSPVSLNPKINANAGTFRTYVFIWDGDMTGLSSTQSTVYWRINWNVSGGQVNSTYQALYVTIDNTQ